MRNVLDCVIYALFIIQMEIVVYTEFKDRLIEIGRCELNCNV